MKFCVWHVLLHEEKRDINSAAVVPNLFVKGADRDFNLYGPLEGGVAGVPPMYGTETWHVPGTQCYCDGGTIMNNSVTPEKIQVIYDLL